jgi:hypothetical protein
MRRKAFRMVQKRLFIARKVAFTAKPTERSDKVLALSGLANSDKARERYW